MIEKWYVGIFVVIASILVCTAIHYELRKISAFDAFMNVLVGRYAMFMSFWIILAIVACLFIQVRHVLLYINAILLIIWFIVYLKNTPDRIEQKKRDIKEKTKTIVDEVKNGFNRH